MEVPNFLCFCPLLAECTLVHHRQLQKHFYRFRKDLSEGKMKVVKHQNKTK
jgi:hypothetical protein